MKVYIKGDEISLTPKMSIGKGGEADIYKVDNIVYKLYKQPDHPDFLTEQEKQATELRLAEIQNKLKLFPKNLPSKAIVPIDLITDKKGSTILGYTMRFLPDTEVLLKYGERQYRENGVSEDEMVRILVDLYNTVGCVHTTGIVLGDFNDLNVLVKDEEAFIIDFDSCQFGKFYCRVYTTRFVDPLLCDDTMVLNKAYNANSDWFSYATMVMQSLLFVGPYGGIYKPKNKNSRIIALARPKHKITVFNSEVVYPKPARHYSILPDDLLQYFHEVFEKDKRDVFPIKFVAGLEDKKCSTCGLLHFRSSCPICMIAMPEAVKQKITYKGKVSITDIFKTTGRVLYSKLIDNKLYWLYWEDGKFKREDGSIVIEGKIDKDFRYRINELYTYIGKKDTVIWRNREFGDKRSPKTTVDTFGNMPVFDVNKWNLFYVYNGMLKQNKESIFVIGLGMIEEFFGDVVENQTQFWVGDEFGFGFYRAGNLSGGFVFDCFRKGIKDVAVPKLNGLLIDSSAVFTKELCWFFVSLSYKGEIYNHCIVINKNGEIRAVDKVRVGDGTWLEGIRGKTCAKDFLLSVTDTGVKQIIVDNGKLVESKEYPDTEPFVASDSHIIISKDGLYVVSGQEIKLMRLG